MEKKEGERWRDFFYIIRLLKPFWKLLGQSVVVGVMYVFLSLPGPYLIKVLIDEVYPQKDFSLLHFIMILGAGFSCFLGITSAISSYFDRYVNIKMSLIYRSELYWHIQNLDFPFFDKRETGEILSRFGDMSNSIEGTIGIVRSVVINITQLAVFPAILFAINWKLALISMVFLPAESVLNLLTRRYYRRFSKKITEGLADLSAKSYESLSSIRTVQALGLEIHFHRKLRSLFFNVSKTQLRSCMFENGMEFLSVLLKSGGILCYGWYGWIKILNGDLSLGTYLAFSGYVGYLYGPIESLIGLLPRFESTLVHTTRFLEIHNYSPRIKSSTGVNVLSEIEGEIAFNEVSFSYDGQKEVLSRINLSITSGTTVALVGPSGSGKSTLAKLVPRFYDPDEGYVSIDEKDVRSFSLQSLRGKIGYVMQGSILFRGTILENLTFGRDIPQIEVEEVARMAYVHEFVVCLPKGYQTEIGEQGSGLSEGQKQRLALARVLLQKTPVLILDEPTAALDIESEHYVQQALEIVRQGRTTLIIAHRLSTIRGADEIVVMNNGMAVERGSHSTLLAKQGVYARMHKLSASV